MPGITPADDGHHAAMNGWKKKAGLAAASIAITGYGLLLWKGPWWLDGDHIRSGNLQPADGVVITGFRTMLVAIGAGVIAAFGLYYTHRNHQLARAQFVHTQEQFALAQQQFELAQRQFSQSQEQFFYDRDKDREVADRDREGRATEQYVTSVKLLGSGSHAERMGAVYSLQQIAETSERYRTPIRHLLDNFASERYERIPMPGDGAGNYFVTQDRDTPTQAETRAYKVEAQAAEEAVRRL